MARQECEDYDVIQNLPYTAGTIHQSVLCCKRFGNIVIVSGIAKFDGLVANQNYDFITGLPKANHAVAVSVANEYGNASTATMAIASGGTKIYGKCSTPTNFFYFEIVYFTTD